MMTMKLEDIIAENPSKVLLSAQGTQYHEDRNNPKYVEENFHFKEIFRIVTKEQANIIEQCVEKNKYYNFRGATDENHGFDIETFGLDFISQLDYGLNEYTYETISKNPQLIEQIKTNPQVAQYVAQAVNEHIKIRKNIEATVAEKDETRYSEVEYYLEKEADSYSPMEREEREWFLEKRQEDKQREIFQKQYSTSEEDIHDSEIWYMERMKNLKEMYKKGNIEMFEPIDECELSFLHYSSGTEKDMIKLETLKEGNVLEYLKESGSNRFKVKDKKAEELNLEQDEISNLQSVSHSEIEHNTGSSQLKENIIEQEKSFFKKIIDKIKRFFNKKLLSAFDEETISDFDENPAYDSGFKNRQKDFFERNKVLKDELLKQDKQEEHNGIKILEETNKGR